MFERVTTFVNFEKSSSMKKSKLKKPLALKNLSFVSKIK